MTIDDLSTYLQSNLDRMTNDVRFLASKKFLIGFRKEKGEFYKTSYMGRALVENLRLVLDSAATMERGRTRFI